MLNITDYRALFLYDSQSDDAVLSGGNWLPELPLSYLQSPRLERIARSVDASPASTRINIALRRPVDIAAIYIGWTSLTPLAKARVQFWPSSSFSGTPDFDGGWLEDLIPADDDADRGPSLYIMLDQSRTAQFVSIEIDDRFNLAGSIDLGRLIIGRYVKPSFNYSYDGNSFNFVSRAIVATTLSGDEMVWDRAEPRTFAMGFQYLPEAEVLADFYRMWRAIKRGGEVVVIPRPDAGPLELQRRSFLGRAVNRDPIIQAVFERGHASLEIREVMGLAPIAASLGTVIVMPADAMRIRDFAPAVVVSPVIVLPVDGMAWADFAPAIHVGAVAALPVDEMVIADYPVSAGSGIIIDLPADGVEVADFSPAVVLGAAVAVPADLLDMRDYAPTLVAGTTIGLPADAMSWRDFAPSIGNAVIIAVPTDALGIADFEPAVGGGADVPLPADAMSLGDFAPRAAVGTIVALGADDALRIENYVAIVRGFDAGFNMGFGGGGIYPMRRLYASGEFGGWWDPFDIRTLFQDVAGTIPVTADSDPVALVLDKSGNGRHLVQATGGNRPLFRTDGTLRWLEFDGSQTALYTLSTFDMSGFNEVSVFYSGLKTVSDGTGASGLIVELSENRTSNNGSFSLFAPTNTVRYGFYSRGSNPTSGQAVSSITNYNSPHTAVLVGQSKISTDVTTLSINQVNDVSGSQDLGSGNYGNYTLYVGARGGTTYQFGGRMYGLAIRAALTSGQLLSDAQIWLGKRAGLTL